MNQLDILSQLRGPQDAGAGRDLASLRLSIDRRLDRWLAPDDRGDLATQRAMRMAVLGEGKRIRPLLTILAARCFGHRQENAFDIACAIELIHAASLILDDLPCMDDASLRRGQPTLHRRIGEGSAILVAVALMNRAFEIAASADDLTAAQRIAIMRHLTRAIGPDGLVGGQRQDIAADDRTLEGIVVAHRRKTGALFIAAVACGAALAGTDARAGQAIESFGASFGLAYQGLDDMLDVLASSDATGKDAAQDAGHPSLVASLGVEGARMNVRHHRHAAITALQVLPGRGADLLVLLDHLFDAV